MNTEFGGTILEAIYAGDREIVGINHFSLKDFLNGLSDTNTEGKVDLFAYTSCCNFPVLEGDYITRPNWFVTDGIVKYRINYGKHPFFNQDPYYGKVSYIGWCGEGIINENSDYLQNLKKGISLEQARSAYFIETSLKADELRRTIKNLGLRNINLKCEYVNL